MPVKAIMPRQHRALNPRNGDSLKKNGLNAKQNGDALNTRSELPGREERYIKAVTHVTINTRNITHKTLHTGYYTLGFTH